MKVLIVGATGKYASLVVPELKQRGVTARSLIVPINLYNDHLINPFIHRYIQYVVMIRLMLRRLTKHGQTWEQKTA